MKKVFRFGLVLISLLTLFSCNPFSVDDDDDYAISAGQESSPVTTELQNNAETGSQNLQSQKAFIKVVFNDGSSRTVLPSLYLKNFVLTGKRNGVAEQELAKAATKSDWSGKSIEILTGDWEFTMSAEVADGSTVVDGVTVFKDTQAVSVGSGANVLSFVLKPFKSDGTEVSGGELSVTLSLDPEAKADKARAVLKASDGTEFTKDYPDSGKLSQGASITFQKSNLSAGTYDLEIEFYSENENGDKIKQNSWMAIVRIVAGLKSSATVQNFNLNEVYKITYETNGGTLATGVHVLSYSRKSEAIELATCTKTGFLFMGWYETNNPALADVQAEAKTNFSPQTEARNKTFFALWTKNTVYVKAGGSGNGFSSESPVANFSDALTAIGKITDKRNSAQDFTIKVCGEVNGNQEIPASFTTATATKLTIEGNTGNTTDSLSANGSGTTLTVGSEVPVTIKNLKITGGNAENGGGISVASGATLTVFGNAEITSNTAKDGGGINNAGTLYLGGGVISKNTATNCGGGVYNTGTMFMYGSAVIGDSSKETAAVNSESGYSNKATESGGGIYSTGNLYLGFSAADTEATLTGGVYYNYAKNSGGIYHIGTTPSKELKLNSGSVLYNAERGMYVGKGKFTMTGGTVSGNTALEPENKNEHSWRGAGIYVGADCNAVISDGTISSNKAAIKGGGIHIAQVSSKVTIEGGTISGNTAGSFGSGISMDNGSLKFQGGALVDSSNDVYLPSGKKILVTGKLTAQTQPIAKITPEKWERGTTIVQTSGTNITTLKVDGEYDYTNYFALSDTDWETKLSADNKSLTIDAPIYVAEVSASEVRNGTKSNPFATIADAISAINELNASTTDYTILIKGELKSTLDGTTPVGQKIYDENNTAIKAKSITIKGASGLNESGEPQDVITGKINDSDKQARPLTIATSVPVIIENLKFTGGLADEGGGIYIGGSGKVNLANGVKVCGNTANNYGGGVYIASGAKLGIYGTAQIGNSSGSLPSSSDTPSETNGINKAGQYGGGIYCEGTLGLGKSVSSDGTFSNQAITGGVYANIASYGGGIYTQSDIQMNGNFNIKNNLGTGYGGGIYYATSGTLSCGTFEGNNSGNGGAVCIASGVTVTISGGTFTSNSATSNGGAVYCYAGSLSFSGSPSFASGTKKSNDVYIGIGTGGNGASLSVSGELSVSDPIAITPATWTRGLTVVQAGANYKDSFVLTNGDWNTKISGNNLLLDAPIYVSSSGQADASGTRSNPRKTLEQACELITDSSFDYTIYIAGTLTNVQTISSSSISAASITIKGTDASAKIDLSETGPALTISVVDIPITILNLTITKGETGYHGGGIHIPNSSTKVILGDGTAANGVLITANKGNQGGGIYNAGTLKIYEGVHISNNTATLIDNIADGAGIYNTGELHMFGGKIYSNTAGNSNQGNGGGVFNAGRFNFQGGQIYENTAAGMGGGIYNAGTLTMTAGTIEKNTAIYGAGVLCAEDVAFTMESGSIRENTASIYGGALYNAGTFNIKGSAFIPYGVEGATGEGKNDVFLIDNKYITVTGGLEGTSPLATIRPISYSEGTKVLAAGSGVTLANVVKKFGLTQEGYFIDSEGNLKKGILVETAAEAAEFILNNIASGDDTVLIITGDVSADDFSTLKSAFDYIFDNKSFNARPQITLDISSSTIEAIPDEAFCENRYLKKIILPDSLKTIGKKAFYDSGDLESIDLPDGLVSIGDDAFNTCSDDKFTAIEIPASVTQIGARAFRNLYYLSTVTFASGSKLETLGEEAFGALNITSIELPSGVTQIPENLFASSDNLTSITINGTLTSIGKSAFGGLTKMETITYNGGNADQFKAIPKNGNEWRAYKLTSWSPTTYLPDSTLIICTGGTSCTAAEADHE